MQQVRSSGSVKIISLNKREALRELRRIANRIRGEHPEVREIVLFGSLARGSQRGTSDADVLIAVDGDLPDDPSRRILMFLPYFDLSIGVDLVVLTVGEIQPRRSAGDAFLDAVCPDGVQL